MQKIPSSQCIVLGVSFLAVVSCGPSFGASPSAAHEQRQVIIQHFLHAPLAFERSAQPGDSTDEFAANGPGYSVTLSPSGAELRLYGLDHRTNWTTTARRLSPRLELDAARTDLDLQSAGLRLELIGANPASRATPLEKLPGTMNYFMRNDPAKWRTNLPTYAKVKYANVYPGVDWVCYGNQQQLEYDFVVAPGASPRAITLKYEGAEQIKIEHTGDLLVRAFAGDLRQRKPVAYQIVDSQRKEIAGGYVLSGQRTVRFELGDYDTAKPLVIDPMLVYSRVFGRSNEVAIPLSMAVDATGNAYLASISVLTNAATPTPIPHVVIAKIDAEGKAVYSGLIAGSNSKTPGHSPRRQTCRQQRSSSRSVSTHSGNLM